MSKKRKNPTRPKPKVFKKQDYKLVKDKKTGMMMLSGPAFTKEDIDKAYPKDPEDRVATVIRASVGL